jgi:probable F420-dependent oxidoreductase
VKLELGAMLPAWHWEMSVAELRDWTQGIEAAGFDYITLTDHVLYAYTLPDRPPAGYYVGGTIQHEPLMMFAFLAAATSRVVFQTGVLVLPQRNPVVVAKQVAELDVLSGGRVRLGVGIGWQDSEYEALSVPFKQRASRMEEAVAVLRACWRDEPVSFSGRYTNIREMSMLPKPVTPGGPPIIFGGASKPAEERAARIADGWMGLGYLSMPARLRQMERLREHLIANGRDPAAFPIEWGAGLSDDVDTTIGMLQELQGAGASRFSIGMPSLDPAKKVPVEEYVRRLESLRAALLPALS